MRVLVTGAGGFIGGWLRKGLARAGHNIIGVARQVPRSEQDDRTRWIAVDLGRSGAELPHIDGVEAVVYLAQSRAYREFPERAREIFAVNDAALLETLDWSRRHGVRVFVYASSANVYAASHSAIREDVPSAPASFYGRSKQIGEILTEGFAECFRCFAFRLFTVYGPGQTGMLIPSLVERVKTGEWVDVQGEAGLTLSPVYVTDVTRCILTALELDEPSPGFDALNLGGPEALSIRAIAEQIGEALGIEPRFNFRGGPEPEGFTSDNARLARLLRVRPETLFREGIRHTVGGIPAAAGADHEHR